MFAFEPVFHVDRSGGRVADLQRLDAAQWSYFQICDAPANKACPMDELLIQAREASMVPGEVAWTCAGCCAMWPTASRSA